VILELYLFVATYTHPHQPDPWNLIPDTWTTPETWYL